MESVRKQTAMRLGPECRALLEVASKRMDMSKRAVIEIAVREYCQRNGYKPNVDQAPPAPPDRMKVIHGMTDEEFQHYNSARPLRDGEVSPLPASAFPKIEQERAE